MTPQELVHLREIEQRKSAARTGYRAALLARRPGDGGKRFTGPPAPPLPPQRDAQHPSGTRAEVEDTAETAVSAAMEGYGRPLEAYRISGLSGLDRAEVDAALGRLLEAGRVRKVAAGTTTTFELATP